MNKELRNRGWVEMSELLDNQKRKRPFYIIYLPFAASIAILLMGAFFLLNTSKNSYLGQSDSMEIRNLPTIANSKVDELKTEDTRLLAQAEKGIQPDVSSVYSLTNFQVQEQRLISEFNDNQPKLSLEIIENRKPTAFAEEKEENLVSSESEQARAQTSSRLFEQSSNDLSAEDESFSTNQIEERYTIMSTQEINRTFNQVPVDLSFNTNGSIGFVSQNGEDFGLRVGFEIEKPISKNFSMNSGVRYSRYADRYDSTYDIGETSYAGTAIIQDLEARDVRRSFVEVPIYGEYTVNENVKLKAGGAITYNTNRSDEATGISQFLRTNSSVSADLIQDAGARLADRHGYLGEAVVGATVQFDRIAIDFEATHGLVSNQNIEGRSVMGVRLNYQLGGKN